MKFSQLLFAVLLLVGSVAPLVTAVEPAWESLIGNATLDLAGAPSQNNSCPYLGTDPSCGKYIIGLMIFIVFLILCLVQNLPSEATVPLGMLVIILLSSWGWLPASFEWIMGALGGIVVYMIIYRFIGG